jgi:RHS repeat-associated protein
MQVAPSIMRFRSRISLLLLLSLLSSLLPAMPGVFVLPARAAASPTLSAAPLPAPALKPLPRGISAVHTFVERDIAIAINWMSDRAYTTILEYGPTRALGQRMHLSAVQSRRLANNGYTNSVELPAQPDLRFYRLRAVQGRFQRTVGVSAIQAVGQANPPTVRAHDHHQHTLARPQASSARAESGSPSLQSTPAQPGLNSNQVYCEYGGVGGGPLSDPRPPCAATPSAGDPISIGDGAWYMNIPCLTIGGTGLPIAVGLRYSTHMWFDSIGMSSIGPGWTTGYSRRLTFTNLTGDYFTPTPSLMFTLETGERWPFYASPANDGTYTNGPGNYTRLVRNLTTGEYTLTYRNGMKDIFEASGLLRRVEDRFGNRTLISPISSTGVITISNERTGQAILLEHELVSSTNTWRLVRIKDGPNNGGTARQISLTYDSSGRLTKITDAANRTHTFAYDTAGRIDTYYDPNNDPAVVAAPKFTRNVYLNNGFNQRVQRQTLPNGTTIDLSFSQGVPTGTLTITYNRGLADQRVVTYSMYTRSNGGLAGQITSMTVPNANSTYSYGYDSNGNLTSETDPNGRKTEYLYNSSGDLLERRHYTNAPTNSSYDSRVMEYNSFGQITKLVDAEGFTSTWSYNATTGALEKAERLHRSDTTQRQTTTISTNSFGQITKVTLPDGTRNTLSYDSRGYPDVTTYDANVDGLTGRLAITENYDYDWRGYLVGYTNQQGVLTTYQRSAIGWTTSSIFDAATGGRAIRTDYSYDKIGNVTQVVEDTGTGRLNATARFTYSQVGTDGGYRPTQVTDPLNQTVQYQYTAYGDLQKQIEVSLANRAVEYRYTTEGWLQSVIAPDGRTLQSFTYNQSGQVIARSDARGVKMEYSYDGKGRVSQIKQGTAAVGTYPAINAIYSYSYDRNDHPTLISGPNSWKAEQSYTADPYGRLAWVKDAIGNQTTYSYDSRNRNTRIIVGDNVDAEQVVTAYAYDALDRPTSVTVDPTVTAGDGRKNLVTQYFYTDAATSDRWNLQRVTDPRGYTTTYSYNSLGLLAATKDALGATWSYSYNNLGYLTQITDPRATATATGYNTVLTVDLLGRVTRLSRNGQTESWNYRADGTIASHSNFAAQATTYSYDTAGRLVAQDAPGTSADATFTYTANDLLASATSKPDSVTSQTTSYEYDALNRLAKRSRGTTPVTYTYNANGWLTGLSYWSRGSVTFGHNANGWVTSMSPWGATATSYSYRSTGLLASQTRPNGVVSNYNYDTAGRQVSVKHLKNGIITQNTAYALDRNGNRIQMVDTTYGVSNASYDALNRLVSASDWDNIPGGVRPTATYSYDAAGNLTNVNGRALSYDASDRITTTGYTYDANGNLTRDGDGTTYEYDGLNRLTKTVKGGVTRTYQHDALGNLIGQTAGSTSSDFVLDERSDLPTILGEISGTTEQLFAFGPEGFAAQRQVLNGTAQGIVSPLLDMHGSVRQLTNSSGTAIKNYVYEPFGGIRYQDSGTGSTTLGFTGERRGGDGTIYLRARTYQPTIGRFLQRDSFAGLPTRPQSLNRYSYAEGNPVAYIDPSGHYAVTLGGLAMLAGVALTAPVSAPVAAAAIIGSAVIGGAIGVYLDRRGQGQTATAPQPEPIPAPSPSRPSPPPPTPASPPITDETGEQNPPPPPTRPGTTNCPCPDGDGGDDEDPVTYYRVQGGTPPAASRHLIDIDAAGNVSIRRGTLNISAGSMDHARYFARERRPGANIYAFDIPRWLDCLIQEFEQPQDGYRDNPMNQQRQAPKRVDPTTPGRSYELPEPWGRWLQEYAIPGSGRIIRP